MDAEGTVDKSQSQIVCRVDEQACDELDVQLSKSWLRIAIAGVFAGQGMMFSLALNMTPPPFGSTAYIILHGGLIFSSIVVVGFLGGPLFRSTFGMLRSRRLSIEGLFTLSLFGAFIGSFVSSMTGQGDVFYEVVAIVIAIYTFGRMLSERSQAKLISESERLREKFDMATVSCDGSWVTMPVSELTRGSRVRVEPGEPFTVDGVIVNGVGYVEETALTGEPLPVVRHVGEYVRAGTFSVDGGFEVEAHKVEGERELDLILETVNTATMRPSELQRQANEVVQGFLPFVAGASLATAIYWSFMGTWIEAVLNSMAVLLVACPCALGLATPVAISQGLFRLAQMGLVSRDGALLDALARTKHIFFDKTGTLSETSMRVSEFWVSEDWQTRRDLLCNAVYAVESRIKHPIASALVDFLTQTEEFELSDLRLIPGQGVAASITSSTGSLQLKVGEPNLVDSGMKQVANVRLEQYDQSGKSVCVFIEGQLAAIFSIKESARLGVAELWEDLKRRKIEATILTGDPKPQFPVPESVELFAGQSSADKERHLRHSVNQAELPIFVGDGINDAVAMANASGSIAMQSGARLARSAAMGQLSQNALGKLSEAIDLARLMRQRLRGNLVYAAVYNVIGMLLAASGYLHPIAAAFIMLVSSFAVTWRALNIK